MCSGVWKLQRTITINNCGHKAVLWGTTLILKSNYTYIHVRSCACMCAYVYVYQNLIATGMSIKYYSECFSQVRTNVCKYYSECFSQVKTNVYLWMNSYLEYISSIKRNEVMKHTTRTYESWKHTVVRHKGFV